jgi:hypothetical protein
MKQRVGSRKAGTRSAGTSAEGGDGTVVVASAAV